MRTLPKSRRNSSRSIFDPPSTGNSGSAIPPPPSGIETAPPGSESRVWICEHDLCGMRILPGGVAIKDEVPPARKFFFPAPRAVAESIQRGNDDVFTVFLDLEKRGELEAIGGAATLAEMVAPIGAWNLHPDQRYAALCRAAIENAFDRREFRP